MLYCLENKDKGKNCTCSIQIKFLWIFSICSSLTLLKWKQWVERANYRCKHRKCTGPVFWELQNSGKINQRIPKNGVIYIVFMSCSWIKKMSFLPKLIYEFNTILIKIPVRILRDKDGFILNFIWKDTDPRIVKTILKKKN
jgi:hypothetical protein